MGLEVKKLTNGNVYINGNSFMGKAEEIDVPDIVTKMIEHKALGLIGEIELPAGVEKMEARIKWNGPYQDAMKLMGNPFATHQIQVRGNLETWGSTGRIEQVPYRVSMTGSFKQKPGGKFKQNENVDLESMLNITQYALEIDGERIVEFDALANIWKVGGVDILASYRTNIGG